MIPRYGVFNPRKGTQSSHSFFEDLREKDRIVPKTKEQCGNGAVTGPESQRMQLENAAKEFDKKRKMFGPKEDITNYDPYVNLTSKKPIVFFQK